MASAAAIVDRDNPWPGLASYDEAAQGYFSGRGAETAELVRRIADEAVTVLFGKSGLGKSSLLKAGVFPVLRQRGLLPVPVRLHFGGDAVDAVEQIAAALFTAFDAEQIEYPPRTVGETLWDYLHRAGLRFWTPKVRPVQPVLVLDQFEEVFTLGRSAPGVADALRERLADLAENRIPAALTARVEAGDALPAALDVHARPYKLVLSLREDFLPDLEGWVAAMPSLRRNRMRLLPLQRDQALQAVCNAHTEHLVDAALARRIVDYLASGAATRGAEGGEGGEGGDASVEPALLSLVCRGINEARKREGKARFDDELFEAGKGRIVADFYRESLADQPEALRAFVEDELVTDQGFRNSYSVVQAIASGKATREQIMLLVERRLLRIEHHLGAERVELTHDLLTVPVLTGRKARAEARWAQRESRARRKWSAIGLGMVVALAVLAVLLRNAQVAREDAEAAQRELGEKNATLMIQKQQIEDEERAAKESAESARAAEVRASEAGARALVQAERAKTEAARANQASRLARSREIAARAAAVMDRDRELAVLLGAEALRIADTPEARAALLDAARYVWPTTVLAPDQLGGRPWLVGLDASGRQLVVVANRDNQDTLSLWGLDTRAPKQARWQHVFEPASVGFVTFMPKGDRLLVGRPGRIERLDAQTGEPVAPPIELPANAGNEPPAQLAVSVDGRWLVAAMPSGAALVRELGESGGAWEIAAANGATGVSISDDGQRIAMAADNPLRAAVAERDGTGRWASRPLDVTACAEPQSVMSGASYALATWPAQACKQSLEPGAEASLASAHDAIADAVASAFGSAFAATLSNGDLRAGTGDPSAQDSVSDLKGVPPPLGNNKLSSLSVNANGTRVAWLSAGVVRIASLAGYKLLLAEYPKRMVATEDGRRVVQARAVRGGARVWMTRIAAVSEGRELPKRTWSLDPPPPRLPEHLKVHGNAVVVEVRSGDGQELATTVYDVDTGAKRAGPFLGYTQPAGRERQLLLVHPPNNAQGPAEAQLVRLVDGQVLGRWAYDRRHLVLLSAGGTALLVVQPAANEPRTLVAQAFALRGEQLVPAGRVVDLPASAAALTLIDDAATAMLEQRVIRATEASGTAAMPRVVILRWPLSPSRETSARDPAKALAPAPARTQAPDDRSPSGRFVWRRSAQPDGSSSTALVRSEGGGVVYNFGARSVGEPQFSDDEHWLAYIEGDVLQVLDLQKMEPVLTWRGLHARSATFTRGGGLLRIELDNGAALLAPIDRTLLDGFARWLVTREITPAERCEHGLDAASCAAVSAPAASRQTTAASPR